MNFDSTLDVSCHFESTQAACVRKNYTNLDIFDFLDNLVA